MFVFGSVLFARVARFGPGFRELPGHHRSLSRTHLPNPDANPEGFPASAAKWVTGVWIMMAFGQASCKSPGQIPRRLRLHHRRAAHRTPDRHPARSPRHRVHRPPHGARTRTGTH